MKFEGVVSGIDTHASKPDRVQYKFQSCVPNYVYLSFEQVPDWAQIGDRVIVEVINVDAESRRQHGK